MTNQLLLERLILYYCTPMLCNTISTLQLYGRGNLDEISAEFSGIEPYRAREDSFQRTLRTLELIAVRT